PADKLRRLIRKIGLRSSPERPERIHDLRTTTRRFEAIWQALSLEDAGAARPLPKELKRIRRLAGRVRDMDVLIGYVSALHAKADEECTLVLIEHLGNCRRKHAKKLAAELRKAGPKLRDQLKRARKLTARLLREDANGSAGDSPAATTAAAAVKLAVELAAPARLGKTTLHPYRIAVKEL